MPSPFLTAKKPLSVWNKPISAEWKGLFKSLSKAMAHTIVGKWTEIGEDLIDAGSSLGVSTSNEERFWLLVRNAIVSATFDLVASHRQHLPATDSGGTFTKKADELFDCIELELNSKFLYRPGDSSFINAVRKILQQWLEAQSLKQPTAAAISSRLGEYFTYALMNEWRARHTFYEPLGKALDTPFTKAGETELAWRAYAARLQRQVHEPMFDEPFALSQIYVPLLGAFPVRKHKKSSSTTLRKRVRPSNLPSMQHLADEDHVAYRVVDLAKHLTHWIDSADRADCIRVIRGGPGSGKSSFVKMLAANIAASSDQRVVFVPLYDLDLKESLVQAVKDFAHRSGLLPVTLLDMKQAERRLLIILDGLDELEMRGRLGAETARDFVTEVDKTVRGLNSDQCRIQVIITGRELAVQMTETFFRDHGKILDVLPYFCEQKRHSSQINKDAISWDDPDKLLETDNRDIWWRKFAKVTGRNERACPSALKRNDLTEITTQPLLCFLVALSYAAGTIDFKKADIDLSQIYYDLLVRVYERGYEHGPHRSVSGLTKDDFIEILEQIGLAAWHGSQGGGGRTASVGAIRESCEQNPRLRKLLERFKQDAEAGLTGLLAGFYFRQHGRTEAGDAVFEFTHKSFGEFLAARRIVRAADRIRDKVQEGDEGGEDGWTEMRALQEWSKHTGPAPIDWDLLPFVRGEIRHHGTDLAVDCQMTFSRLFARMLRESLPLHELNLASYRRMREYAVNAESALLIHLNAFSRTAEKRAEVNWPNETAFGSWLRSVQGQRRGPTNRPVLDSLSWLDLSGCVLHILDLYGADLSYSKMGHLTLSVMGSATCDYADFSGCDLRWCNLEGAQFHGANMRGAMLQAANLEPELFTAQQLNAMGRADLITEEHATMRKT